MPTDDQNPDQNLDPTLDGQDAVDDLARRAGAEVRRPAPEGGLAGVHRSHRRRRTATAAAAAAALVVIAGGTIALANRGGDDSVVTEEPTTTMVEATEPTPSTAPEPTEGSEIDGTWWLVEIDGEAILPDANTIGIPEVTIDGGSLSGYFGCNSGGAEGLVIEPGRLTVDAVVREAQLCSIPDGGDEMVLSERVLVPMLEGGLEWIVDGDRMTWTGNGSIAVFTRDESDLPSVFPTLPATLPTDPTTTVPVTTTTVIPTTTVPVTTTTVPVTATTAAPTTTLPVSPDGFAVSDEVLPDPEMFGADGFLRELVDRSIVVRSTPEVVIPVDVPDEQLRLIGVGPDNVAYIETTTGPDAASFFGPNRVLAVPTAGPTVGSVFELFGPQDIDGAWAFTMEAAGIDHLDLPDDVVPIPFIGADGQPFGGPDPSYRWFVDYATDPSLTEPGNPLSADVVITLTDVTTRDSYRVPVADTGREGQIPALARPLPDGRIWVFVLVPDDSDRGVSPTVFALDPATGSWTQHPWS